MNCLIIDDAHPTLVPLLAEIDVRGDYRPEWTRAQILEAIADYDGLIVRSKTRVDEVFLLRASKLQFIGRAGAGLDKIDVAAARERGIYLFNAAEGNRDAVAEHVMG
ncbi:MAG: phosphoglycerate dehydrogenase, partial [Catalinimonas sp.]